MSEIRALLLTDVVDSTQLSERLGDAAMAEVWAAHDRVARDLLPIWRGREIDKTDGMLLLFERADDAVAYARAYHRALADMEVPLRARAGLHVGPVILRENAPADVARGAKPLEVDGMAKPTAARVMSLARGGQTLLTPEARAATNGSEHALVSHGHWVLKGVAEPVELFESGGDPTSFAAPPDGEKAYRVVRVGERWLPVREIRNNLPQQVTSFIGRETELDEIKDLLGRVHLLTLLGMGGLGKTRLSLQAAMERQGDFPDGVWFLDLAPLRDPALVVAEAAQVLDLQEEADRPLIQTLCAHLKDRCALFVVDNCEHLLKPIAMMVFAILRAAPNVRFVASSREPLRVPGEQSYPIKPLPLPKRSDSLETLARSTAVRLFVARAQQHRHGFALTAGEAPAVAELVTRLEGIPLALELAAARVRLFSVTEINRRLADRYKELVDGDIVLEERQQTLRALVDWSYDMLSPAEQQVMDRLAVFAGGFDLDAVRVVCTELSTDHAEGPVDVAAVLTSLTEKSLLSADPRGTERFRMLETLRDYAREKLDASGHGPDAAARHGEHYFVVAKQVRQGLLGPDQALWVQRMELELDNARAAIACVLAGGLEPFIAVKFTVAMMQFWIQRGYATEGRAIVKAALELPAVQASPQARAHALYVGAGLAGAQGDHAQAQTMLQTCLALRREMNDRQYIAATLSTLALARLHAGDAGEAVAHETEALAIFEALADEQGQAIGHLHLGQYALVGDDDGVAADHLAQALRRARRLGLQEIEAECLIGQGELAIFARSSTDSTTDWQPARPLFAAAVQLCKDSGDRRGEAQASRWAGLAALRCGDIESAQGSMMSALKAARDFDMRDFVLTCVGDLGELALTMGQAELGVSLQAWSSLQRRRSGLTLAPSVQRLLATRGDALRAALNAADHDKASTHGCLWTRDEAFKAASGLSAAPRA